MKRVILICADQRPEFEDLSCGVPLALAIYLGKPLIEHALDALALESVSDVLLLVSDRPSDVRAYVGSGSAWGMRIRISPEASEFSPDEAVRRHAAFLHDAVLTLESLPQFPDMPVLRDSAAWHRSRATLLPLLAPGQIGVREISPGVWCGMKCRISPNAVLHPPCWIGHNCKIGSFAVIGPDAFIENDSVIDNHATVESSTVAPRTYLGSMTHLKDSVASGPVLANWRNKSTTRLVDGFLLSRLDPPREALSSLVGRVFALFVMILTSPIALIALFHRPWIVHKLAVRPRMAGEADRSFHYQELPGLPGNLKRWPILWRIVTGDFAWVGNPPLAPEEASDLKSEFDQLWLQAGPALFTAPEAEGCTPPWDEAARAHAALYACQPTTAWKRKILASGLKNLLT